jgi:predicted metal-dependent phosphoesterase TrpH
MEISGKNKKVNRAEGCLSFTVILACRKRLMNLPIDLHFHSTASDGVLSPAAVIERASQRGAQLLALTDHDTIQGVAEAAKTAAALNVGFIGGAELSVTWNKKQLHIVGLGLDPTNSVLLAGLQKTRDGRIQRAHAMALGLENRLGVTGVFEGAMQYSVGSPETISRAHFARYLVEIGVAKNVPAVFKRYLIKGKPGYVEHEWANLEDTVAWIRAAGGMAVIAHPARYELSRVNRELLIHDFKACGGLGMEVSTGSHTQNDVYVYGKLAATHGLLASVGSDFHSPTEGGHAIGRSSPLPDMCEPIWPHLKTLNGKVAVDYLHGDDAPMA